MGRVVEEDRAAEYNTQNAGPVKHQVSDAAAMLSEIDKGVPGISPIRPIGRIPSQLSAPGHLCPEVHSQLQLAKLSRNCDNIAQNGLVSSNYLVELWNKLKKLLHDVCKLHKETVGGCAILL
eukprot:superscaffoldBa00010142_g24533